MTPAWACTLQLATEIKIVQFQSLGDILGAQDAAELEESTMRRRPIKAWPRAGLLANMPIWWTSIVVNMSRKRSLISCTSLLLTFCFLPFIALFLWLGTRTAKMTVANVNLNDKGQQVGAAAGAGLLLYVLYRWRANQLPHVVEEEKYQGGEAYADRKKIETGLLADFKALLSRGKLVSTIQTLLEVRAEKGKPIDDKKMTVCFIFYCACMVAR